MLVTKRPEEKGIRQNVYGNISLDTGARMKPWWKRRWLSAPFIRGSVWSPTAASSGSSAQDLTETRGVDVTARVLPASRTPDVEGQSSCTRPPAAPPAPLCGRWSLGRKANVRPAETASGRRGIRGERGPTKGRRKQTRWEGRQGRGGAGDVAEEGSQDQAGRGLSKEGKENVDTQSGRQSRLRRAGGWAGAGRRCGR